MKHRNHTLHIVVAAALLAGAPLAFAGSAPQQTPPSNTGSEPMMHQQNQNQNSNMQDQSMQDQSMQHNNMNSQSNSNSSMKGWHSMPGTVTSVDHDSGIVQVKTEGKRLRVHFPPKTITNLKKGDKISLDLGYKMSSTSGNMGHM